MEDHSPLPTMYGGLAALHPHTSPEMLAPVKYFPSGLAGRALFSEGFQSCAVATPVEEVHSEASTARRPHPLQFKA